MCSIVCSYIKVQMARQYFCIINVVNERVLIVKNKVFLVNTSYPCEKLTSSRCFVFEKVKQKINDLFFFKFHQMKNIVNERQLYM